jgi:6-phosphogluconolactonase (cycloisomerase 2 family)
MARLLVIAVTVLLAATAARADTVLYVSVAAEKRIAVYLVDPATGRLTHRGDARLDGEPGALTADPGRQFLFAALRAEGKLASFRIDRATA